MKSNVRFRNHFLMVVEKIMSLWIIWLYLIVSIFSDEGMKQKLSAIAICAGIIFLIFIISFIEWRKTTYIFDNNALIVEKNTITKTTTTIAMNNIATVNINRSFIQGILGIRTVKVDTNSTATMSSDVQIHLSKKDALAFQQIIMSYINGNEIVHEKIEDKAGIKEIFMHCIYTMQIIPIIVSALVAGFFLLLEADIDEGDSIGGAMSIITMVIAGIAVLVSFFKSFFAYYKLEAVRNNNEISISYGFFDKKEFKMPIKRVVSIKIKEPLIGRLFKKAYAEIVCVGMGDEEKELSYISLCTSKKVLATRLHNLLPEFIPEEVENDEQLYELKIEDVKSLFVRLFKAVDLIIGVIVGAVVGTNIFGKSIGEFIFIFAIIVVLLCILIIAYEVCTNRTSGYNIDSKYVRIANGAFNREITFIPYENIEHMTINKSPVNKLLGLVKANIYTKSGALAGGIVPTCYMDTTDMDKIRLKYRQSYTRG